MAPISLGALWSTYATLTSFLWRRDASCPPGGNFQTHCWGFSVTQTGALTTHCERMDEIYVNALDLGE